MPVFKAEKYRKTARKGYTLPVPEIGKLLFVVGLVLAVVGLLIWSGLGRGWFGQLPGDVSVSRGNFSFHFPIVTCLVISLILTVVMWLFRR
jgi:hypothetical protein